MAAPTHATDEISLLQRPIDVFTKRVAGHTQRGTNTELACLDPFSPEITSATMTGSKRNSTSSRGLTRKIAVIAFVEGLKINKFKESLLKKRPSSLEEINERVYKYIRIEEAWKRVERGYEKRLMEETRRQSPHPKRRSALDRIRVPDRGYSRANLPRGSAFSCLQGDPKREKEMKEGKIEYQTLSTPEQRMCSWRSRISGCFRDLPSRRPPKQKGHENVLPVS
ncbi:hypothetical protein LIER_23532 [Lithospermum erythrorhizon]|uniref:Uncharacterized protein n=1 Tax=Lithospermum erythrorhizon TaxID=34254 RepID=A0AAV3R1I9_LITER